MKQTLLAIDQGVNALCGGYADSAISSCAYAFSKKSKFWNVMESMIDYTFKPIDGEGHCKQSFNNDLGEKYTEGSYIRKPMVAFFVTLFCVVGIIPIKVLGLFK